MPFRHRSNPVFDESLEVIVDGETATRRDLQVQVEIWMTHMVRKPTFKARPGGEAGLAGSSRRCLLPAFCRRCARVAPKSCPPPAPRRASRRAA